MAMVTVASCERCGARSENPGADNWKQVRVYPIGAVFEMCRQCGADCLEFLRAAPPGSLREAELAQPQPQAERVVFLDALDKTDPARAARVRRLVEQGDTAAAGEEARRAVSHGEALADAIVDGAKTDPQKPAKPKRDGGGMVTRGIRKLLSQG